MASDKLTVEMSVQALLGMIPTATDVFSHCHVPSAAEAKFPVIRTPANWSAVDPPATLSALSLNWLNTKFDMTSPNGFVSLLVMVLNVALPMGTGASLTGVTSMVIVLGEPSMTKPELAVEPESISWKVKEV